MNLIQRNLHVNRPPFNRHSAHTNSHLVRNTKSLLGEEDVQTQQQFPSNGTWKRVLMDVAWYHEGVYYPCLASGWSGEWVNHRENNSRSRDHWWECERSIKYWTLHWPPLNTQLANGNGQVQQRLPVEKETHLIHLQVGITSHTVSPSLGAFFPCRARSRATHNSHIRRCQWGGREYSWDVNQSEVVSKGCVCCS